MANSHLPVAIIGAGPVGLAAASHLVLRGLKPIIFERGASVGASLLEWSHVRVFSPWEYNIDGAARTLLLGTAWEEPEPTALPTGGEIVERYLRPLAELPAIGTALRLGARVTAVTRKGLDKVSNAGRAEAPFELRWTDADGVEQATLARAVIDASGTWTQPNPMGVDGLPVRGERAVADLVTHGIPDVAGGERDRFAGRTTLVVGSGHSAINAALALLSVQDDAPDTKILWALRRSRLERGCGTASARAATESEPA